MKVLIFYFLFAFTAITTAQSKKIYVYDDQNKPLASVFIYNETSFLGKTNKRGFFEVKDNFEKIILVKEHYYDVTIHLEKEITEINLLPIKAIELEAVEVVGMNTNQLLDKVLEGKEKMNKNILRSRNNHFYDVITKNTDTIFYIDKRLHWVEKNSKKTGWYALDTKDIIENFTIDEESEKTIFRIRVENKEIHIPYFSHWATFQEDLFILKIIGKKDFQYREQFDFVVSKTEEYYKIEFTPKSKNKKFPVEGYFIVDIENYSVYEFKMDVSKNLKRKYIEKTYTDGKPFQYEVLKQSMFAQYAKNKENKYELITYNFEGAVKILKGNFENAIFTNKCIKEPTEPFNTENLEYIELL